MGNNYNAAVVGAGPGGLSSVAALLNAGAQKILCVDPTWRGGRLNGLYRDISSNTTVAIYLKAIHFSDTLRSIIDSTPAPNAVTKLESMDHSSTCQLSVAGDMICLLIEGLLARPEVEKLTTTVDGAHLENDIWTIQTTPSTSDLKAHRITFCTGSHPQTSTTYKAHNPISNA